MIAQDAIFKTDALAMSYRVYTPVGEKGELPLLVYLHGAGERGDTPDKLDHILRHGIPRLLSEGKEIPAWGYVVIE